MQPLLAVVVALLVARLDSAPQPLSLFNATELDDSMNSTTIKPNDSSNADSTLTTSSEKSLIDDTASSSSAPEIAMGEDISKLTNESHSLVESRHSLNSGSVAIPDKVLDTIETTSVGKGLILDSITNSGMTESSVDVKDPEVTSEVTVMSSISPKENVPEGTTMNDGISEETPISRYVPPLDPMIHMFMMAEAKKQLEVSTTESESEITTVGTTFDNQEAKTTLEDKIPDSTTTEKDKVDFVEIENADNTMTDSSSPVPDNHTVVVIYVDDFEGKERLDKNDTTSILVQNLTTSVPTTVLETEVTPTLMSNDTVPDNVHESSILIKSSELFSGKDDSRIAENSLPTSESTTVSDSTESAIFSSSSITTDSPESTVVIATTQAIKSEELNDEPSFMRIDEEIISSETTTEKDEALTTEEHSLTTELTNFTEVNSVPSESDKSFTAIEEMSFSLGEKLSASESETSKNLSLSDPFEFRSGELPFNESNVIYSELTSDTTFDPRNTVTMDSETTELASEKIEMETTSSGILATIKEMIFPSSTTKTKPPKENTDSAEHEIISNEESEIITDSSTPETMEMVNDQPESEIELRNMAPELMKVELLESDIDSISTIEEDMPTTLAVEIETKPEEVVTDPVPNVFDAKNASNLEAADFNINEENLGFTDNSTDSSTAIPLETSTEDSGKTEEAKSSEPSVVTVSVEIQPETTTDTEKKYLFNDDRYVSGNNMDTVAAVQFLHYHDKASSEQCFKLVDAHWNYATNLSEENKKKQLEQTLEYSLFHKEAWRNATSFAWKAFNDTLLRRWFKSLSVLGTAALPEDKLNEFNRLKAEMKNTYSTAKVCPPADVKSNAIRNPEDCTLTLEPELQRILTKSRDYDELAYVWKAWRDAAGKPIREKYLRFVNLSNEAARLNGFPDTGDMWREAYESDTFEEDLEMLWDQLKPLYQHLHAYVRRKLIQQYGNDKIKDDGPIPAHLFGNMWAQSWVSLMDIAQPFPGKPSVDVTPIMEAKNLTALEMFKISEEFFISLGLKEMPEEFWKHSLIEKPTDREIICHASAWDFCNGKDYRIKQCTDITMEDLITVHHEMGHIQYFLQYARQPNVFREGANPGFHEAIGDVLALSVSTPKHLKSIGLLEEVADDPEGDLNFLLRTALDKVSFLPSGYLIDLWRWGLFSGDIKPEEMNTKWWELRLKYQGICPPVKRHDTDFDPGAKYHVPGNVPYIRYFVSFVIQFQFHKVLCDAAGHTGPLYKCDIYRSKEAGQILSQVMELGSSEHWSEAMKIMTGGDTNRMDAGPIMEYFEPLLKFLEEQNMNETLGWISEDSTICP